MQISLWNLFHNKETTYTRVCAHIDIHVYVKYAHVIRVCVVRLYLSGTVQLSSSAVLYYFVAHQRNHLTSFFQIGFWHVSFALIFRYFLIVIHYSIRMEILLYLVSFCPLKSIIDSILGIQFSRHPLGILSRGKEKI